MLRLEFYPAMVGLHMRAVGIDRSLNPDGTSKEGETIERTVSRQSIEQWGLAYAITKALWDLHTDFPDLHKYARR